MKFIELGLSKSLLTAIEKENYIEATPIQEMSIPHILNNKDVLGIAQTGTGKTAAFALPILEKLIKENKPDKKIKALILSPTRELAIQIRDNFRNYAALTNFKCSVILGGVNQSSQINVLKQGVDILVATPGRLLDLVKRNYANLSSVKMLVLDEADTMLDMGFIRDIKQIVGRIPADRQTMLFSATMPKEIKELANDFLKNPVTVSITPVASTVPKIKQSIYYIAKKEKLNLLLDILNEEKITSALVFTRTKHGADKLSDQLREYNVKCGVIHGNKSQPNRVKALANFKEGKTPLLIATDIAARGIDINELSHVINYDMPEKAELYVHRIGRTARAGHEGISISLCSEDEMSRLRDIEKLIKQRIPAISHKYTAKDEVKIETTSKNNHKTNNNSFQKNMSNNSKHSYNRSNVRYNRTRNK
ncbi:MAG: DEAD/DEAH box helicase [Bacilli bacterium]